MKWLVILSAFAIVACSGFAREKKNHQGRNIIAKKMTGSFSSFAVLELFTSEGCSSCPPADRLLPQLANLDPNVIPLSFHVDYWNHLGWTDPFSNEEFTDRQRNYANRFRLESIYTPQLIINGEYELVGSNRSMAEADIKNVLKKKAGVEIKIDEVKKENNKLLMSCSIHGDLRQTELIAVLVQKHAEMKVKAGENSGAKLSHTNVVRSFIQKPAQEKMNFEIEVPKDLTQDNLPAGRQGFQLILYSQQKPDLRITGVAVYENGQ